MMMRVKVLSFCRCEAKNEKSICETTIEMARNVATILLAAINKARAGAAQVMIKRQTARWGVLKGYKNLRLGLESSLMLRATARWPALRTFFDLRSRAIERNHRTGSTVGSMEQDRGAIPFGTLLSEVVLAGSALLILLVTQWVLSKAAPGANYFRLDGKLAQSLATTAF